jgi:hypothetical protein
MGKMKVNPTLFIFVVSLMLGWTLNSMFQNGQTRSDHQSGSQLLYQVALFQFELLNNALLESISYKNTEQFNALKQAAYSVEYTHERFLISLGATKGTDLNSMTRMMDYILRLQIGGNRLLKPDESEVFQSASKLFIQLFEDYAKLMSSQNNDLISSQNTKVHKIDQAIVDIFSQKLLE